MKFIVKVIIYALVLILQVTKLSLLVGTKGVGDSVRRLMGRMFHDELLTKFSLQGKKRKKNVPVFQFINYY
jgi:hypothetical protein